MKKLLLLPLVLLLGCGYTARSIHLAAVDSVYVPVFDNRTFRRGLEFDLTRAVTTEILHKSDLRIASRNRADTELIGEIVDIDEQVVEFCREYLPRFSQGAFDDARVELVFADARGWIERQREGSWDAVISDLTEPLDGGPSAMLFTREFYRLVRRALAPGGGLVVQAGAANPTDHELFSRIQATVAAEFDGCRAMLSFVPSFADQWSYVLGFDEGAGLVEPEAVDELLAERVAGEMFHYDGECHRHCTSLPLYLRRTLQGAPQPFTDASPPRLRTGSDL